MNRIILFIFIFISAPSVIYAGYPGDDQINELVKQKLDQLSIDANTRISGEKIHSIEYVSNLYARNNFQPFWTKPEYVEDAIRGILSASEDGLLPEDYHLEAIRSLQGEIYAPGGDQRTNSSLLADLDLLITDGIIFYADHLLYGKIDPVALVPTWNFGYAPIPELNPETFAEHIVNREIPGRLKALRPQLPMYDTLTAILDSYREIAVNDGWGTILIGGKIEPGDRDSRIPAIRKRLLITGGLSQPDSVDSGLYDAILEKDVKAFQASHALDPDGVIGAGTFRELNIPVEERIASLRVNLERARWVSGSLPENFIIVNIAAFYLVMVKDGKQAYTTRVVVGKPLNKTPVFRDKMRYIEFNPTWTQPASIVKNETIPKLKKDSTYLEKNHMVLLDSKGNVVPTSTLDFQNLSASRFPYLVRQEPGPWNALGEMKFMFPNKYDIYLHDTPSKSLFSKASRAYSHGCIRVNKPLDLAVKLLEGTEYDRKKISGILETHITTRANLPEPVDILLMYWTCGIDPEGRLFFAPDIYDRDMAVLRDLDRLMR